MTLEEQQSAPDGSSARESNNTSGETPDPKAEATQLRQELARAKQIMQDALPNYQLGEALRKAKGGASIIERIQKGEDLTAAQEAKIEQAAEDAGLTKNDIQEMFKNGMTELEDRIWESQRARDEMQTLHRQMGEKYPGYDNIYKTTQFKRIQQRMLSEAQSDPTVVPAGKDPYEWILEESVAFLKHRNPDLWDEKPARKTEQERKGAIAATSQKKGATPDETDELELPSYVKNLGKGRLGKSLKDYRTGNVNK